MSHMPLTVTRSVQSTSLGIRKDHPRKHSAGGENRKNREKQTWKGSMYSFQTGEIKITRMSLEGRGRSKLLHISGGKFQC